ncbi:GNAT family N-acetyltransferase [Nocardioides sp. L-11A]|uniref:GNAT family N-acetyltransferase n=1 Tax=Nocardioides sp. L-11A TaxID=3043848 RepID=UPI00249C717E|nr:GNAT family N-acetyltransferase [Nocardioides sp. L-11A]
MTDRRFVHLPQYGELDLGLSSGVRAGDLMFISGQAPIGPGETILGDTIEEQTAIVMDNFVQTLQGAGLDTADVVKTTVFLRSAADFPGMDRVYAGYFGADRPARSTLQAVLMHPDLRVEIEGIAVRRPPAPVPETSWLLDGPDGFHLRLARPSDAAELTRHRRTIFEGHPQESEVAWLVSSQSYLADRLGREDSGLCAVVVEEPDGTSLVASAIGWIDQHLPAPMGMDGRMGHIGSVVTDPEHRGRGLASALVRSVLAWFDLQGVARVELQTTPMATALYRSLGFEEVRSPVLRRHTDRGSA